MVVSKFAKFKGTDGSRLGGKCHQPNKSFKFFELSNFQRPTGLLGTTLTRMITRDKLLGKYCTVWYLNSLIVGPHHSGQGNSFSKMHIYQWGRGGSGGGGEVSQREEGVDGWMVIGHFRVPLPLF